MTANWKPVMKFQPVVVTSTCCTMPLLSGNVNVTVCPGGSEPSMGCESFTVVAVTFVTVVPGAIRPATGTSVMPTAMPLVAPEENFRVLGLAAGVPDEGVAVKEANGGFIVNVTEDGEPVSTCETITVPAPGSAYATVVPLATPDPETPMPIVTPVVSAKCSTTRSPSSEVAPALVAR